MPLGKRHAADQTPQPDEQEFEPIILAKAEDEVVGPHATKKLKVPARTSQPYENGVLRCLVCRHRRQTPHQMRTTHVVRSTAPFVCRCSRTS